MDNLTKRQTCVHVPYPVLILENRVHAYPFSRRIPVRYRGSVSGKSLQAWQLMHRRGGRDYGAFRDRWWRFCHVLLDKKERRTRYGRDFYREKVGNTPKKIRKVVSTNVAPEKRNHLDVATIKVSFKCSCCIAILISNMFINYAISPSVRHIN